MGDERLGDRALATVAVAAFLALFALGWALPEDRTCDRLYQPVAERGLRWER